MQKRRLPEDSAASSSGPDPVGSLRARSRQVSTEHPDLIIPTFGVRTVHMGAPDVFDVNPFLKPDYQSPETIPTADITPSTLPQQHLYGYTSVAAELSPLPLHLHNPQHVSLPPHSHEPALLRTPVRDVAPAAAHPTPLLLDFTHDQEVQQLGGSDFPFQQDISAPCSLHAALQTPLRDAAAQLMPLQIDVQTDKEVQALARANSPLQDMGAPSRRITIPQTPVRDAQDQFCPAHSPIGRLQYSPKTVPQRPSTTPVEQHEEREGGLLCQCPQPFEPLAAYRVNYPKTMVMPNRYSFFKLGVHNGKPGDHVKVSLDSKDKKISEKCTTAQRIEHKPTFKTFIGDQKKKGGQSASGISVDVQLASLHHPQYCLQINSFLSRIHDLRNNFEDFSELYRHICPRPGPVTKNSSDIIDEAIPRLLLLHKIQDNWAIALLVRFTLSRNPRSGIQAEKCFMDMARLDFLRRSGNHIMGPGLAFGDSVVGIPLSPCTLTNHTRPQLYISQDVQPNVCMNMKDIRQSIIRDTHIPEHAACRITYIDGHIYYIGPFYFRKVDYQVAINIGSPDAFDPEVLDLQRQQELTTFRLQFYCQHMRNSKALPHDSVLTPSTPRCACGLPLEKHDDISVTPPCYSLRERMTMQPVFSEGVVEPSYSPADKQHWEAIHAPLPPALGDKKNPGQKVQVSNCWLNIGALSRWVLMRDVNLEDASETLRHDILWHFSPHKACWAKPTESKSAGNTPRSKTGTPVSTPLATAGGAARAKFVGSFGMFNGLDSAQLPHAGGGGGGGGAAGGGAAGHKRSLSFSPKPLSPPHDQFTSPQPTVQRKKNAAAAAPKHAPARQ